MATRVLIIAAAFLLFIGTEQSRAYQVEYQYDELNRLIVVEYKHIGRIEYTYDAAGNRLLARQMLLLDGDINMDGSINLTDVIIAMRILTEIKPQPVVYSGVETDNDGRIGIPEVIYMLQTVSELRQ